MAWIPKRRNESVDLSFSSIWNLASQKDSAPDSSPYVSISNVAQTEGHEEGLDTSYSLVGDEPENHQSALDVLSSMASLLALDHSSAFGTAVSWAVFGVLGLGIPLFMLNCSDCSSCTFASGNRLALTAEVALAVVSFIFMAGIPRGRGLRNLMQLEEIEREGPSVRSVYKQDIHDIPKLMLCLAAPTVALDVLSAILNQPNAGCSPTTQFSGASLAFLVLRILSWGYRTSVYLFVCILFRLLCTLQILRVQAYVDVLGDAADESQIVKDHMNLRDQMATISHQFRLFLLFMLLVVCCSQASALYSLLTIKTQLELSPAVDLLLSSFVQLVGAVFCLHGAAQITHRTQRMASTVSQWHAVATCGNLIPPHVLSQPNSPQHLPLHRYNTSQTFLVPDDIHWRPASVDRRVMQKQHRRNISRAHQGAAHVLKRATSDTATAVDIDAIEHDPKNFEAGSFNKRQALVSYLSHSPCGITVYGFTLDRGFYFVTFGFIFSIALFVVNRAIANR